MSGRNGSGGVQTFPVAFTGVSANRETVSIGIKIDREHAKSKSMEECFCGHRLEAELRLGDGSPQLPGMEGEREPIEATFDAMRYSAGRNEFTTRLRTTKDIDLGELSELAGKKGRLLVHHVEDLPDDEPGEDLDGAATANATPLGKGSKDPVSALGLSQAITERLENYGLKTVGELIDLINTDEIWHRKIKGIGEVTIDKVTNALNDWYAKNPEPAEA